jgi:ligand-binding sensor domain-containing protein
VAIHTKTAVLGGLALAGLLAGAYLLGTRQAAPSASVPAAAVTTVPAPLPPPAGAPAAQPPVPAAHPPVAAAKAPAGHPAVPAAAAAADRPIQGKVGAALAPDKRFTHFRVGNKNVKRVYVEGGQVWVGTSGGLIRYTPGTDEYKLYDARSGLLSNGVFYVGRMQGRIVVGTYGGGLSVLDAAGEKWRSYNIPEGLGDAFVYDVLEAKNGDVWIATWSGVNRVRGGALDDASKWELHTVQSTKSGLPNDWVYGLAEGRDGDIWLATEGGMALYRQGKWSNWNHARGLGAPYDKVKDAIDFKSDPSKVSSHHAKQKEEMGLHKVDVAYNPNYVVALAVDKAGTVWAGTWGGGLARYDGTAWRNLTRADGLPGNHVFMLHHDAKGRLWVGTNNGLARMEGGKFSKVMTTEDGLFANAVFSMASTPEALWVGSFGGVAQIRRSD